MQPACPHLSQLDRAAGLRCSCTERNAAHEVPLADIRRRPTRSRTMAVARVFGPYLVVIAALVVVGLITGAIERI